MMKLRRMRWGANVAQIGEQRNAYRDVGGKARSKVPTRKTKT
jgi:hypothetical protein